LHRGDALVVKVELVDAENDAQLWGEQYSRQMADLLSLEEEISNEIGAKLRLKISGEPKKRASKLTTQNIEAYQLYLKGRYHQANLTPEGIHQAINFLQQAIERDPDFALAYSGLSDCYGNLSSSYIAAVRPADIAPRAKAAALKALEFDPMLAEA